MAHIIIQIIIYQLLFLIIYDLLFQRETFFTINRMYLLVMPVLSIALPFVSIDLIQQQIPEAYYVQLPAVLIGTSEVKVPSQISWTALLWILGAKLSMLLLVFKLFKILKLRRMGSKHVSQKTEIISLPNSNASFSFLNTIYLGENIPEENKIHIIQHEKAHIQQKHSLDMLFFEILRVVFWFNPVVYLYQTRISIIHEYIADCQAVDSENKSKYYQSMLSEAFQIENISFINPFFNKSLIKKRIIMLKKSPSPRKKMMKYLLLIPLLAGISVYTSCSNPVENVQQPSNEKITPPPPPSPLNKEDEMPIPYATIDKAPVYPGCSGDLQTVKTCMTTKINELVSSNFNIGLAKNLNLSGKQRISVQFKISDTGKIIDVRARAQHPDLENEAIRVVKMLPDMEPGEQDGQKVAVLYSLPIEFEIEQ